MSETPTSLLTRLSAALRAQVAAAGASVAGLRAGRRLRTATLWRPDILVASEQALPDAEEFAVVLPGGGETTARLAGRDAGTNIAALRLKAPADRQPITAASDDVAVGALVTALGADGEGGATARLGVVQAVGPAWTSLAGGRIDRSIRLDLRLGHAEEGGPVLTAEGAILGISTLGPRGRVLVIPNATIERVLTPLLTEGRVARGWLGVGLQPVALSGQVVAGQTERRDAGLMVVSLVPGAPAELAGVLQGDILLDLDGSPTTHPRAVGQLLDREHIGKSVEVRLLRAGAVTTLQATVAARPA